MSAAQNTLAFSEGPKSTVVPFIGFWAHHAYQKAVLTQHFSSFSFQTQKTAELTKKMYASGQCHCLLLAQEDVLIIQGPDIDQSWSYPFSLDNFHQFLIQMHHQLNPHYKIGTLWFYPTLKQIKSFEEKILLTEIETQLLHQLCKSAGHVLGKEKLLQQVWSITQQLDTRTLETHIYTLRKKLAAHTHPALIETLESGYILRIENKKKITYK